MGVAKLAINFCSADVFTGFHYNKFTLSFGTLTYKMIEWINIK
jgi:hypothetical protein